MNDDVTRGLTVDLDKSILEMMLEIYYQKTNHPIGLFLKREKDFVMFPSREKFNEYCRYVDKLTGYCMTDHTNRCSKKLKGIVPCHAGLLNFHQSILLNGKHIGTLATGQSIIKEEKKKAEKKFQEFLDNNNFDENIKGELRTLYNDAPKINKNDVDVELIKYLSKINQYILSFFLGKSKEIKDRIARIENIAYEFKAPPQAIIAKCSQLQEKVEKEEMKILLEQIIYECMELDEMANNMMKTTEIPYKFKDENIYEILFKAIDKFKDEAKAKGVDVLKPKKVDVKVRMASEYLQEALNNVIHNAVKYSWWRSGGGYIDVSCKIEKGKICISVSNYGTGISEEELKKGLIFEKGYRGLLSGDRDRTGSGLGLFHARNIIEEHDGKILAESKMLTSDKNGPYVTTFYITLPIRSQS